MTRCHNKKDTECSWSHPGWILERLEPGMKILKHKILMGRLEGNISICFDNIKMCLKETTFDLTLISSTITQGGFLRG